jgi:UDP-N-acetylglucosamine--N-acetylmuramyl-(pentapeptide) pyrophosphoryl-undecaprenol N-acetylglucosamine transferase
MKKLAFFIRLAFIGLRNILYFLFHRPAIVVGFGGYVTAPTVLAAHCLFIKFILHESNAICGKANAILAPKALFVTTGFREVSTFGNLMFLTETDAAKKSVGVSGLEGEAINKKQKVAVQIFTGNPVRSEIAELANHQYLPPQDELHISVIGGSQGSEIFADVVPQAVKLLSNSLPLKIVVKQQAKPYDANLIKNYYDNAGIPAEVLPFFEKIHRVLGWSNIIISRSGASTLAEISLAGIPAIFVPFKNSINGDQAANAAVYAEEGAAVVLEESVFSAERLHDVMVEMVMNKDVLPAMSRATRSLGSADAVRSLAEMVEKSRTWRRSRLKDFGR